MAKDMVVIKSEDSYIFNKPRYGFGWHGGPTHIIFADGSEQEFVAAALPFSTTKEPVRVVRRYVDRQTPLLYGDLLPDEYNKKREELESKGWYDDDEDHEWMFDNLDDEYAYKKFIRDHPVSYEEKDVEEEVKFGIFHVGQELGELYINPISSVDVVEENKYQYYMEIPDAVVFARFRSQFDESFELREYGNKVTNLGHYRNQDVRLEYSVQLKGTTGRVDGEQVFVTRRIGNIEDIIACRDRTFQQIEDLANSIKAQFRPADTATISEVIKTLESIKSRAARIAPMQKSRGEKNFLINDINTQINKLKDMDK